jgi:hypothetical protein
MRPALTGTLNCVALRKAVVSAVPFHITTELLVNPDPFTVTTNAGVPATAEDGLRPLMTGAETGVMTMEQVVEVESGEPPAPGISESTTVPVKPPVPVVTGVPVIAPVDPSRVKPTGNAPLLIENV